MGVGGHGCQLMLGRGLGGVGKKTRPLRSRFGGMDHLEHPGGLNHPVTIRVVADVWVADMWVAESSSGSCKVGIQYQWVWGLGV